MKNWIYLFFATTFFSGFLPEKLTGKPGAGAGLVSSLIAFFIQIIFLYKDVSLFWVFLSAITSTLIGLAVVKPAEEFFLEKWGPSKRHDGEIVTEDFNELNIDEVPGQFIAGLPVFAIETSLENKIILLTASLVLFRLFDVLKPGIIKWPENNLSSPYSVIFDDVFAGVAAALTTFLIIGLTSLPLM